MVSHTGNQSHKRRKTIKKDKKFRDLDDKEKEDHLRCYFKIDCIKIKNWFEKKK